MSKKKSENTDEENVNSENVEKANVENGILRRGKRRQENIEKSYIDIFQYYNEGQTIFDKFIQKGEKRKWSLC